MAGMVRICRWAGGRCLHPSLGHCIRGAFAEPLGFSASEQGVLICPGSLHLQPQAQPRGLPTAAPLLECQGPHSSEIQASKDSVCQPTPISSSLSWALRLLQPLGQSPGPGIRKAEWGWSWGHICSHWAHSPPCYSSVLVTSGSCEWDRLAETAQPGPRQGQEPGNCLHWQHTAEREWGGWTKSAGNSGVFWEGCWWGQGAAGCLFYRSKCVSCNHFRPPLGFSALPTTVRLIICANVLVSGEQYCCYI